MMNRLIATTLLSTAVAFIAQAQDVTGTIHANQGTQKIYKEIYGQFAEDRKSTRLNSSHRL